MISTPRIVVAGTHSGVGKTTIATGLMAALAARGLRVAGFKIGPDFIDPSYHRLATGTPSRNLDVHLSGEPLIAPLFARGAQGADVAVIEGVMGLFDGAAADRDTASTAHVARLLDAPVLLVVDAAAMARSVAALVHGFATFAPDLRIAGVVVNRLGSPRHAALVRTALEPLGIPVVGTLLRDEALHTPARHLGLVPAAERAPAATDAVTTLGQRVGQGIDLDLVLRLAGQAPGLVATPWEPPQADGRARIAVAGGPAFSFTYTENLEALQAAGAEIVPLDPTRDETLEALDALYLGGGFPEEHAEALSANTPLRAAVADLARSGRPVVAECGGLLYLCAELDGLPMCGVLDATASMTGRLHLGYRRAEAATDSVLWRRGEQVRGHEFHYSATTPPAGAPGAWRWEGRAEGFAVANVHASYLHTHWAATPHAARRLVEAAA